MIELIQGYLGNDQLFKNLLVNSHIHFPHCEFSLKISNKTGNDNHLFDLFGRRVEYVKIDVIKDSLPPAS